MDKASIIGGIACLALVLLGVIESRLNFLSLIDPAGILITILGSFMATIFSSSQATVRNIFRISKHAFISLPYNLPDLITELVQLSENARKEGLLSLEDSLQAIQDPFLRKGLQLIVDGTDPELVKNMLENDLANAETRHMDGVKFWGDYAIFLPAFGLLGTLLGLIAMLKNLGSADAELIGFGLSIAFVNTFYGSFFSNILAFPMQGKLQKKAQDEVLVKSLMVEGILSIQAGDNPRIVSQRLASFLPGNLQEQYLRKFDKAA